MSLDGPGPSDRHQHSDLGLLHRIAYVLAILCFVCGILLRNDAFGRFILDSVNELLYFRPDEDFRLAGLEMTGSALLLFGFLLMIFKLSAGSGNLLPLRYYPVLTVSVLMVFYWNYINAHAVNVPLTDDYYAILRFLNAFIAATPGEQASLVWTPYVETRNVMLKLTVVAYHFMFKTINFRALIFLVNLAFCALVYLVFRGMKHISFGEVLMIPFSLILFNFTWYDAQLWSTAGMHIIFTMFFASAAFFFLEKRTSLSFTLALFSACLSCLSYGNGWLVFVIGLLILFWKKDKRRQLVWLGVFILMIIFYFRNYQPVRSWQELLSVNPLLVAGYCLVFLGSAFQFFYRLELPVLAGTLFILVLIWLIRKKYYLLNPFNFSMLLYVAGSAILAAFFRLDTADGIRQALAMRYAVYSCLGMVCLFIALAEMNSTVFKKRILPGLIVGSGLYFLASAFCFYPETVLRKKKLEGFIQSFQMHQTVKSSPPVIPVDAAVVIERAVQSGIFKP